MQYLSAEDPRLEADISAGSPVSLADGVLLVRFGAQAKFIVSQLRDTERLGRVAQWLSNRLGKPTQLELQVEAGGPSPMAQANEDPAVQKALDLFDGQIVKVKSRNSGGEGLK